MGYSKQITYNTIGNVLSLFCQWLIIMIIPKITNFNDAGIFAIAISICSILNIFATFSLNSYQIADQYNNYSENGYRITRIFTIILSFAMIIPFIIFFDYTLKQIMVIITYMVYRNLIHYGLVYAASLQINHRLDIVGILTGIEGIISFISFTTTYLFTHNLIISTFLMALMGGGFYIISIISGYDKYVVDSIKINFKKIDELKPLLKIGIPLMTSTISAIIITALPKLMLQSNFGEEITGIFSTLSAPTIVIPTLVTSIFAPFIVYFSNMARDGNIFLLKKEYTKLTISTLLFGLLCVITSITLAPTIFKWIYGDYILEYLNYFHILIVGIVFYAIGMNGSTVLVTKNQGRAVAISSACAMLFSLILLYNIIPTFGIAGATYGLLFSYMTYALFESFCVYCIPLKK